jgi:HlyD family secretion protein
MTKKILIALAVALLASAGLYAAFLRGGAAATTAQSAPTTQTAPSGAVAAEGTLLAEARVVPLQSAALSAPGGGIVAELLVAEGEQVQPGQVLLRLDPARAQAAVAQAEAQLAQAQASYEQLRAGATPEEIAAAEAELRAAQAQLRQAMGSVTAADQTAAAAQLQQAQAHLAELQAGTKQAELQAAQAALDQARTNLQAQRDSLSAAKTNAQLKLEQAANTLRDAQDEYSRLYWDNEQLRAEQLKYGRGELPQALIDKEAATRRAVENSETALAAARLAAEQAQQAEITGIQIAEAELRNAEANLARLTRGATADELAGARAQVASSQASLEKLRGDQRGGALDAAQAAVDQAQATYAQLRAGVSKNDLAVAAAEVQSAQAALQLAQVAVAEAELRAPFAGTVAALEVQVGEYVAPGTPVVQLADLSAWQIETTDLTELNIVRVRDGSQVAITFDAIPDLELLGTVSRIRALGENQQGDITYAVIITLDQQDLRLRWNMTASAAIAE